VSDAEHGALELNPMAAETMLRSILSEEFGKLREVLLADIRGMIEDVVVKEISSSRTELCKHSDVTLESSGPDPCQSSCGEDNMWQVPDGEASEIQFSDSSLGIVSEYETDWLQAHEDLDGTAAAPEQVEENESDGEDASERGAMMICDVEERAGLLVAPGYAGSVFLYMYDITGGWAAQWSPLLLGDRIQALWHTSLVVEWGSFSREFWLGNGRGLVSFPETTAFGRPVEKRLLGYTDKDYESTAQHFERCSDDYFAPEKYDVLSNNCNHLSDAMCIFLLGQHVPPEVLDQPDVVMTSRLARVLHPLLTRWLS